METTTDQPGASPDPSHSDQREAVLTRIIVSLPKLLERCEDFQAATIAAGLLKAYMNRRVPDIEPEDDLDAIVRKAQEEAENDVDYVY
jgi:hypothetical protein